MNQLYVCCGRKTDIHRKSVLINSFLPFWPKIPFFVCVCFNFCNVFAFFLSLTFSSLLCILPLSLIFAPHCGPLSNLSHFNLPAGCVQGGQIPRPRGDQERHGAAHSLQEAALNQENLCLLPRSHCQVLVQHGMEITDESTHAYSRLGHIQLSIMWWFIWIGLWIKGSSKRGCCHPGAVA